jgi:FKBP12-rapamycin complex-associated protein
MQLFGLVNTLSPGAGLLGWVQNSDTLHMLIKGYRESRKILVDIEHRLMQQVSYRTLFEL